MSTKIYNGIIFENKTLEDVLQYFKGFEEERKKLIKALAQRYYVKNN